MTLETIIDAIAHLVDTARSRAETAIFGERSPEEVKRILSALAATKDEKLDWEHSATDLCKLLGFDSSLEDRKDWAADLGYKGKLDGSAKMNEWLHGQIMKMVANREAGPGHPPPLKA